MIEIASGGTKTVADLSDRICLTQMTEQHRSQMRPGVQALRVFIGLVAPHQSFERITVEEFEDLAE